MRYTNLFRKKTAAKILEDVRLSQLDEGQGTLQRTLNVRDLTALGIAAIIGAGIFTTIGKVSYDGGPAVVWLFIFTAMACAFSAFCYAEFASMIPISGSAYTYSYAAFGELIAWIIGWDLLMEYSIGNIAVAISWSEYFTSLLREGFGLHIPEYFTMDFLSAMRGHNDAIAKMGSGESLQSMDSNLRTAYEAWTTAPTIGSMRIIADLPALLIVILITWLIYVGIRESKNAGSVMVLIKLAVIILVIGVGAFYINTDNWDPFNPEGITGVLKGVSGVFFAYIGFDALSTTAEECKDPQRDLPKGMFYSLLICTILYILIALVLTGMVHYKELNHADPLAFVFNRVGMKWMSAIISVSAIFAMASVLLVFQLGQPRIWMSMSRDGLMPQAFGRIHPKYKTPHIATIITGILVAVPALFMNLTEVTDLSSFGTLFAFVLVCGGVLVLQNKPDAPKGKFRTPYFNAKFVLPVLFIIAIVLSLIYNPEGVRNFFTNTDPQNPGAHGWDVLQHRLPFAAFIVLCLFLTWKAFTMNLSLIPCLGPLSCFYLMSEVNLTSWLRFLIWLAVGLVIYFTYSYYHSKLRQENSNANGPIS